jgi:cytochrome c-type biogenesis protein
MDGANVNLVLAFAAGLLSASSPCVLPLVPIYLSYIAGAAVAGTTAPQPARLLLLRQALFFVAGFSIVFVALGALAGLIGLSLQPYVPFMRQIGGVVLVVLGLHTAGVLRIPLLYRAWRPEFPQARRFGQATSFVVGMVFAFGWTPCVGPVLGGILLLASTSETALSGAYLLAVYSLGMGIPFIVIALLAGSFVRFLKAANHHLRLVEIISGVLLVGLGVLVFTGDLARIAGMFLPPL